LEGGHTHLVPQMCQKVVNLNTKHHKELLHNMSLLQDVLLR